MAATTWTPPYHTRAVAYTPRGGGSLLDVDCVTSGGIDGMQPFSMVRDAHGGPLMVKDVDRLISRIVRAVATPRGSFWADPAYGSAAVPGVSFGRSVPMQILSAVMTEISRYAISAPISPSDRIGQVRVNSVTLADDARTVVVDIVLFDGAGVATPAQISF